MADDSIDRPAPPTTTQVPAIAPAPTLQQPLTVPSMDEYYQSYLKYYPQIFGQQMKAAPYQTAANVYEQQQMMRGAFNEQMYQMPVSAEMMYGLDTQYMPQYTDLYNQLAQQSNPEFFDVYGTLGQSVNAELAAGYDLGAGLTREMEQSIRGAQTARGNILGAAPTAEEAFGKGSASIDLYNSRVVNAQNFLQGKQPTDLWGALAMAKPTTIVNEPYYPSTDYISGASAATSATAETATSALSSYNSALMSYNASTVAGYDAYNNALIGSTETNNAAIMDQYNAASEYWMYDEAVKHGLYSTPQTGGGSSALSTGIQAGTAVIGAGATAYAGAAASAAGAAICWLARRVIPERWEDFQHWLFTRASDKLRRLYIYTARRLAREVTDAEAAEIGELMEALCLR